MIDTKGMNKERFKKFQDTAFCLGESIFYEPDRVVLPVKWK